ncbi:MAG TPA: hypothetical protein VFX53_05055 [Pedococcus sp.]|nr:hypothetical protein [Pedococcus sp.]
MKANRKFSELRAEIAADPIRAERLDRAREEVNRTYGAWCRRRWFYIKFAWLLRRSSIGRRNTTVRHWLHARKVWREWERGRKQQ